MPTNRNRSKATLRKSLRKPKNAVTITPEGVALLNEIACKYDFSKSELIEYLARGSLAILNPRAELTIKLGNGNQPQQKETIALESYELLKKHLQEKDKQIKELQNYQTKEKLSKEALQKQIEKLQNHQSNHQIQDDLTKENLKAKELEKKVDSLQQEVNLKQGQIEKLQNKVHQLKSETEQVINRGQDWLIIIPLFLVLTISFALFLSHYYPNAI